VFRVSRKHWRRHETNNKGTNRSSRKTCCRTSTSGQPTTSAEIRKRCARCWQESGEFSLKQPPWSYQVQGTSTPAKREIGVVSVVGECACACVCMCTCVHVQAYQGHHCVHPTRARCPNAPNDPAAIAPPVAVPAAVGADLKNSTPTSRSRLYSAIDKGMSTILSCRTAKISTTFDVVDFFKQSRSEPGLGFTSNNAEVVHSR
jgi:hypothetical protein